MSRKRLSVTPLLRKSISATSIAAVNQKLYRSSGVNAAQYTEQLLAITVGATPAGKKSHFDSCHSDATRSTLTQATSVASQKLT